MSEKKIRNSNLHIAKTIEGAEIGREKLASLFIFVMSSFILKLFKV